MNEGQIQKAYDDWMKLIAEYSTLEEAIEHFRVHAGEHYLRHQKEGDLSVLVWIIGCINLAEKFKKMLPQITTADLLFKLCRYHLRRPGGVEPPFDMEDFLMATRGSRPALIVPLKTRLGWLARRARSRNVAEFNGRTKKCGVIT